MSATVRFRVWVAGELVENEAAIVDPDNPDDPRLWDWLADAATRHARICDEAEAAGQHYLVDIEWWDGEHVRFGSGTDVMVDPLPPVELEDLEGVMHTLVDIRNLKGQP